MPLQYCFRISNPDDIPIEPEKLKVFVKSLYVGKKSDQFDPDDPKPAKFKVYYIESDSEVCIELSGSSKVNIAKMKHISDNLSDKSIKWKKGITLNNPYEYGVTIVSWSGDDLEDDSIKWRSIIQRGPYFPDLMNPYQPLKASLSYEGKDYPLSASEERVAYFYAEKVRAAQAGTGIKDYTKDSIFNANFWRDFQTYLSPEHLEVFKDFKKIGWKKFVKQITKQKESVLSDKEKIRKQEFTKELERSYGFAILDGNTEKLENFKTEPSGLFMGRGEHPKRGSIKPMVYPENVILNLGKSDPIPDPPAGYSWGGIMHDHTSTWVAKFKTEDDEGKGTTKYIRFSSEGTHKGKSDLKKFEVVRKLNMHIEYVRSEYTKAIKSADNKYRKIGTALFLIDSFGIRPGGEKDDEDEADTVGVTTLRVEHVKLLPNTQLELKFLGKDSIEYHKIHTIPIYVYNVLKSLISGRSKSDPLFEGVSAITLNVYLQKFDRIFSAKVLRTRLGNQIMYEQLKNLHVPNDDDKPLTKKEVKNIFNKANTKVADVLNHTRTLTTLQKEGIKKLEDKLADLEEQLKQAKADGKATKKLETSVKSTKSSIENKKDTADVAVETSLTNYIDPRLVVSWIKREDIEPDKIYSNKLLRKFKWAIDTTDETWDWMSSPLLLNPHLQPAETDKPDKPKTKPDKPKTKPDKPKPGEPKTKPDEPTGDIDTDDDTEPVETSTEPIKTSTEPEDDEEIDYGITKKEKPVIFDEDQWNDPSYKILLEICKNPKKAVKILNVSKKALMWIYPYSKYIVETGNGNILAAKIFVKYYENKY